MEVINNIDDLLKGIIDMDNNDIIDEPIAPTVKNNIVEDKILDENISEKININVGGKNILIYQNMIEKLNIKLEKLNIIQIDGQNIYFLDNDYRLLLKIINFGKTYGLSKNTIEQFADKLDTETVIEMVHYKLLDKKFLPESYLSIPKNLMYPNKGSEIITVEINGTKYTTLYSTLSKSKYFANKLVGKIKNINVSNDMSNPKIFRYVLNALRYGHLYFNHEQILEYFKIIGFDIEYNIDKNIMQKKINYGCLHVPVNADVINYQQLYLLKNIGFNNIKLNIDDYKISSVSTIYPDNKIGFDTPIIFDLTNTKNIIGEFLSDIVLILDLPIIHSDSKYIDKIENSIIQNLALIYFDSGAKNILMNISDEQFYSDKLIYYNKIIQPKKIKIIYNNNLIDVLRIHIPLSNFIKSDHLIPLNRLRKNNKKLLLQVKLPPVIDIVKNIKSEIFLLNSYLVTSFINYHPYGLTDKNNHVQINQQIKNDLTNILFTTTLRIDLNSNIVKKSSDGLTNIYTITLNSNRLIKDMYFTLTDNTVGKYNFVDDLIDMELFILDEKNSLMSMGKFDSSYLSTYLPLKLLKNELPAGIYYYGNDLKILLSEPLYIVIKTAIKKLSGSIYINHYVSTYM